MRKCGRPDPGSIENALETLGLEPGASEVEIRRVFRRLAFDNHPDKHPDDAFKEERFKLVAKAYEILTDPKGIGRYQVLEDLGNNRNDVETIMRDDDKWRWDQFSGLFV